MSIATLKRIPTLSHAPTPIQHAEASLRPGLVVPLTLVPPSSRRIHQHVHYIAPVVIAPTPAAPPFSLSLRHDALHGVDGTQSASTFDKNASAPITIDSSKTITRSSLYIVPQGRYAPISKSGQTRYGNIDQSTLDNVGFSCGPEKEGGRMTVAQILEGLSNAYLDGANETILQRHRTNITLHTLVGHFQHFLEFRSRSLVHLQWSGHAPWTTLVCTKSWKDWSVPITRGELALRLARALKRFTVVCVTHSVRTRFINWF